MTSLVNPGKSVLEFMASTDPERTLLGHLAAAVDQAAEPRCAWQPGRPLRLLLAGYLGAGNVGSDMRSGEIVRQVRYLLGRDNVAFDAIASSDDLPAEVLADVRPRRFNGYFPEILTALVAEHDGVIACEGSMFKSNFSNVLSAIMAASLGMASRAGKLAVGYGAEVAPMDPPLAAFVRENAAQALTLCRNEASRALAADLGLRAVAGADTAWTLAASGRARGEALLRELGWNGSDPVLCVCPVNPFWWPVKLDPLMEAQMRRTGAHKRLAYTTSFFFHSESPERERKYGRYVEQVALAATELARSMGAFTVLVAMERLDVAACRDVAAQLPAGAPVLLGANRRVGDVVALLRRADLLVSSRFHALVGAMPAGGPSIGVTMDERIRRLFAQPGAGERFVEADDEDLAARVVAAARGLDADAVRSAARSTVSAAVEMLGHMGLAFADELARVLPAFPLPSRPRTWQAHLAPLPPDIQALLA